MISSEPWYHIPVLPKKTPHHAIIIGGGLAGTSVAYYLAKAGWNITLIDQDTIASQTSGNRAAILMPLITHHQDTLGKLYFKGYMEALEHLKTLNFAWHPCGVVDLNQDHAAQPIENTCIPQRYMELIEYNGRKAYYFKNGGVVDMESLCQAQLEAFKDRITVISHQAIASITEHNGSWHVCNEVQEMIAQSSIIIVANNQQVTKFEQLDWLPLQKTKGQLSILPTELKNISHVLIDKGYITPFLGEGHHIGSTYEGNEALEVTIQGHKHNLSQISTFFEGDLSLIDPESLKGRVAYRSAVPDRRAVVGPVPNYHSFCRDYAGLTRGQRFTSEDQSTFHNGLYVSTAHGSRGLTSCIYGAKLLSEMITGKNPDPIHQVLLPTRFIVRALKRRNSL